MVDEEIEPAGAGRVRIAFDMSKWSAYLSARAAEVEHPPIDARFQIDPYTRALTVLQPSRPGQMLDTQQALAIVSSLLVQPVHRIESRPAASPRRCRWKKLTVWDLAMWWPRPPPRSRVRRMPASAISRWPPANSMASCCRLAPSSHSMSTWAAHGRERLRGLVDHLGDRTAVGIGGGVCQVSTTAFRAAFSGGFEILERWAHGYRVSWYEIDAGPGLDATIYAPDVDFKFRNDTDHFLLIQTYTNREAATVTFRFYGTPTNRQVAVEGPLVENAHEPRAAVAARRSKSAQRHKETGRVGQRRGGCDRAPHRDPGWGYHSPGYLRQPLSPLARAVPGRHRRRWPGDRREHLRMSALVGHEWALHLLLNGLAVGRFSHATLICGPPNIGKTTLARIVAQALNCTGPAPAPCGDCRSCHKVASGNHPDVRILDAPGQTLKIDQVRELQREMSLSPYEGRWRVAVLCDFERATMEAANALLKTLEEPPGYVALLLTATQPDLLLPTIVSRCQLLSLRALPINQVREALVSQWGVDTTQAEAAGPRVRWPAWSGRQRPAGSRGPQPPCRRSGSPARTAGRESGSTVWPTRQRSVATPNRSRKRWPCG